MNTANVIIECLRHAVIGKEIEEALFDSFTEADFVDLFKQAKRHDVANVVAATLSEIKLPETFKNVAKAFEKEQMTAVFRCENIVYEIERISDLFSRVGIDHILLKGAVIRDLYPEPWMRTSCDIDVLIREESINDAIKALAEKLDYSYDGRRGYHDVPLYSPGGVHLELHFSIMENVSILDRVLSRVWDYAGLVEGCRYELSPEFFMYHVIAHTAYHFIRGGCGIRSILDLCLIKNNLEFDKDRFISLCRESEIEEFYYAATALADCWFSDGKHSEITEGIERFILDGGTYGDTETGIAALQESRGGKLGYAKSRIWISYHHLQQRYPSLKSRVFIPVYQVRRWIEVVLRGKLKRSARELKLNKDLDSKKVSSVMKIMHSVGLDNHLQ